MIAFATRRFLGKRGVERVSWQSRRASRADPPRRERALAPRAGGVGYAQGAFGRAYRPSDAAMATAAEETSATADAAHAEDVAHASAGHHDVGYYALYFLFLSLVLGALARGATRHSRMKQIRVLLIG